jgi:serine phosphatase RsbU (regulator of sigma subunit)/anti-sigma regulatory factor (Ser/Thr protein kinase)
MQGGDGRFGDHQAMVDAFEQSPQILGVVEGPELRLVAGSGAMFETMAGKELLGVPLRESFSEVVGQQIIDQYEECYRTGEVQVAKEWRTVIDPGGGREPFEFYIDFLLYPWKNADGTVRGVVASATDVTASVVRRVQAEQAQERAERRYQDAVAVVTDLQDALLPEALPVLPGLDLAAWYLLATEDTAAGGDWFDAVVRPEGRVALVVGDVVGHGVKASAVMGQLRAVLQQRLLAGAGLTEALADLDLFARAVPEAHAATVCVVEVDPHGGEVEYCTAGHPPPLVVTDEGPRFLEPTGSGPLATGTTYRTARTRLEPDELVLLYSDGIVERPGRTPAQNTVELLRVVGDSYLDRAIPDPVPERTPERVCHQSIELLTRLSGYSDDITLLAAQPVPEPAPYDATLAARAEGLAEFRAGLDAWLDTLAVRELDRMVVQHTLGELVTNAVEHAYAHVPTPDEGTGPTVHVTARLERDGALAATVTDSGRWRPPGRVNGRGRGLAVVSAMVDALSMDHDEHGTRASVRHLITRPAQLVRGEHQEHARPVARESDDLRVEVDEDTATVRVSGAVDAVTAQQVRSELQRTSRGGTTPVTVDLSGVTLLASAGVHVLHDLHEAGLLTVLAPPGSAAQHVLDLVDLPYSAPAG